MPPPQFVKPDGVRIAFYCFGPEQGRPLVICHGLAASALQFAADAMFFAEQGFRVIAPDLRGHGASGVPAGATPASFSLGIMAADVSAILDACNAPHVAWIGNSLGGLVGLALFEDEPDRVISLATFGTSYSIKAPRLLAGLAPLGYRLGGRRLSAALTAFATTPNPPARALVRHILESFDPAVLPPLLVNLRHYDLRDVAERFPGPVLMIRGSNDRAVNRTLGPTLALMRGRANFTLVDLPGAGHCANLDAPDAVRTAILEHLRKDR